MNATICPQYDVANPVELKHMMEFVQFLKDTSSDCSKLSVLPTNFLPSHFQP